MVCPLLNCKANARTGSLRKIQGRNIIERQYDTDIYDDEETTMVFMYVGIMIGRWRMRWDKCRTIPDIG
jgi:hypothetical protein